MEEDFTGEGIAYQIFVTSGSASQAVVYLKITTEAECKLAAEYNSKNNIDQNEGYGGRGGRSSVPPDVLL